MTEEEIKDRNDWMDLALSRGRTLTNISNCLEFCKFSTMPNSDQPSFFRDIKRILDQAGYKF